MLHGYEMMYLKCTQAGYMETQETTSRLLKLQDPLGEKICTKSGNNYTEKTELFFFFILQVNAVCFRVGQLNHEIEIH